MYILCISIFYNVCTGHMLCIYSVCICYIRVHHIYGTTYIYILYVLILCRYYIHCTHILHDCTYTKNISEHMSCILYFTICTAIFNFDCIWRILIPFFLDNLRTASLGHDQAIRGAKTLVFAGQ